MKISHFPHVYLKSSLDSSAIGRVREVILNERHYLPYFDDRLEMPSEDIPKSTKQFQIGDRYVLQGTSCDDFSMPSKVYEIKGVLGTVNDICLNSVVVKQLSGEKSTIFSLTKTDCQTLGIPFERELQIFPQNLNWTKVTEEAAIETLEFDANNMATYPVCVIDETIRKFIIKLSGFTTMYDKIVAPDSKHIPVDLFIESLKVRTKKTLLGDGIISSHISQGRTFNPLIVTGDLGACSQRGQIVDDLGNIFIEVDLTHPQAYTSEHKTEDRRLGVQPQVLEGPIHDIFEVVFKETYKERQSSLNNLLNTTARRTHTDDIWRNMRVNQRLNALPLTSISSKSSLYDDDDFLMF